RRATCGRSRCAATPVSRRTGRQAMAAGRSRHRCGSWTARATWSAATAIWRSSARRTPTPLPTTGPWPRGCAPDRPRSTAAEVAGSGHADGWSCWPSPAKLNLFLHIPRRRADGYHELQTVFRLLDWGDTVRIRVRADPEIRRIGPSVDGVPESGDLLVRA